MPYPQTVDNLLIACCGMSGAPCGRTKQADGTWADSGARRALDHAGAVSHGLCPSCYDRTMAAVRLARARSKKNPLNL